MLSIIVYIPKWESFQGEWLQSIHWIYEKYDSILIVDGADGADIPSNISSLKLKNSNGLPSLFLSIFHQICTENTLILRQGFPLTEELVDRLLEEKSDSIAISYSSSDSLSDDCLLFSTSASFELWREVNDFLFCGYAAHFQALLQKAGHSAKTIPFTYVDSYQIQQPNVYLRQQMSNILSSLLKALNTDIEIPPTLPKPIMEKVSIVVLVWNNLKVTVPCLLSIMKFTKHPFELIIVDNGSSEPVELWVKKNLGKYDNVIYHRNESNQGFPQGCNDGMAIATGEHILLLNNDTIVTPFWLTRQVAAFVNPKAGLVGPLSINCSRNQNILSFLSTPQTPWKNSKEMLSFTNREDEDYCFRTSRMGYTQFLAKDVFVDHIGSTTFNSSKLPYQKLLWQNILYSHYKNLSDENLEAALSIATSYERANISREYWKILRTWDPSQDHIPFKLQDYLHWKNIPKPRNTTLIAFPSIFHSNWIPTIQEAIKNGWNIILRIEPPSPYFTTLIQNQVDTLSHQEQQSITISCDYKSTAQRMQIYEQVSEVLFTERFDWFRFDREASVLGFDIRKFPVPVVDLNSRT